jgi:hypothetical protein
MKLIQKHLEAKMVDFHGIELQAPVNAAFFAADNDGRVFSYTERPKRYFGGTWDGGGDMHLIATVDLDGMDWRETLVEVGE